MGSSLVGFAAAAEQVTFYLFIYGTLQSGHPGAELLRGCERICGATVGGILYNIDDQFPALVLYGNSQVSGEIWRCPFEPLKTLDAYEGVSDGLFRRVGVTARAADGRELGCWTYVAGPKLAHKLTADRRVTSWHAAG